MAQSLLSGDPADYAARQALGTTQPSWPFALLTTLSVWWNPWGASALRLLNQWLGGPTAVTLESSAIRCGALFPYELGSAVSRGAARSRAAWLLYCSTYLEEEVDSLVRDLECRGNQLPDGPVSMEWGSRGLSGSEQ